MWHKIEYEALETPTALVRKTLPNMNPNDWYWIWQENGLLKVCFRHQSDHDKFLEVIKL